VLHKNLAAYSEYEIFSESAEEETSRYKENKLKGVERNVEFVSELLDGKSSTVLEWGSGNSKFLYLMQSRGLLKRGYGIEVSKTRHEFAERWRVQGDYDKVVNINADVLEEKYEKYKPYDLLYCADLAFQFFEPISARKTYKTISGVYENMNIGGRIVLELDASERILTAMSDNKVKLWEEFQEHDPWQYVLWNCTYNEEKKFLKFDKTFLKRGSIDKSYSDVVLRIYTRSEACELLESVGFKNVRVHESWDNKPPTLRDEYIVVGEKQSSTRGTGVKSD
jgi:hypothetical protein